MSLLMLSHYAIFSMSVIKVVGCVKVIVVEQHVFPSSVSVAILVNLESWYIV